MSCLGRIAPGQVRPLDLSRLLPSETIQVRIEDQTLHDIEAFALKHLEDNHRIQVLIQGDEALKKAILTKLKEKSQGMYVLQFSQSCQSELLQVSRCLLTY